MKKQTKDWLCKAEEDLKTANINLKSRRYDASAFFVQQALEKALKAMEIEKFDSFDKTHDLYFLGKKLKLPKRFLTVCDEISGYYVETRYPDTYAVFDEQKVSKVLNKAKTVIIWIKKRIL